ncbi:MAG: hypothetical protein ACR2LI_14035 [Propionibacteriaceae bacterium]
MTALRRAAAAATAVIMVLLPAWVTPVVSAATGTRLTNLAHLDFLLDDVTLKPVAGHTTYRLAQDRSVTVPWTYADARPGGTFERVGGGPKDPVTGDYGQGAFNADDIARAAVVYLRDWRQSGNRDSRHTAYELLRAVAYLQTDRGRDAGNVVLWMQADGDLNPSADPVELPDPSDSADSYWLARTIWAYGEGYAAFRDTDPEFAAFLKDRLALSLRAVDREVLHRYGRYAVADGVRVPDWLITGGADVSPEAMLGLNAYVAAVPGDRTARRSLSRLADGVAAMGTRDRQSWPYGAVLPWTESRSMWHAWSSQMSAALAGASTTLARPDLLTPALREATSFDPTLITAGGPDNGWYPTPVDRTQIAYGADSRLQSLLAVADASRSRGVAELAGIGAGWYFGTNASGAPVYDRSTGVTYDGVAADGTVNANSGAESTIHGLLSMLALDAHPAVRARALGVSTVVHRDGLRAVEAETSPDTDGTVVTPTSAWTGESQYGGGAVLRLTRGESARIEVGASDQARLVEAVVDQREDGDDRSRWTADGRLLGRLRHRVGDQGVTAAPGALVPQRLARTLASGASAVQVTATRGTVDLDAILVRPLLSRAVFHGVGGRTELVSSAGTRATRTRVGTADECAEIAIYDNRGRLVDRQRRTGVRTVRVPAGGFVVVG